MADMPQPKLFRVVFDGNSDDEILHSVRFFLEYMSDSDHAEWWWFSDFTGPGYAFTRKE